MTTLIYTGAGDDNDFLSYMPTYDKYMVYDALPYYKYYKKNEAGFKDTKSRNRLRRVFGTYENLDDGTLFFKDHNLIYHYSIDSETIHIPKGDILIKGYAPRSKRWIDAMSEEGRKVFVACDTIPQHLDEHCVDYKMVHMCRDYCDLDSADSDSDYFYNIQKKTYNNVS
jgi:hypothetical protein